MHGVLICVGYSLASWVGLGFYFVNASGAQWRLPLAIQCLPPLFLSFGVLMLPESPRWLLDHDRIEDAYKSFKAVRAETNDAILNDEMAIQAEFNLLQGQLRHEKLEELSLLDLFRRPSMRKRCIVGWLTMFGAQGTATLVINSKSSAPSSRHTSSRANIFTRSIDYGPSLYASLGFDTVQQLLIQCGWITVCPFGNWINAIVVDRVGRTRMLSEFLSLTPG